MLTTWCEELPLIAAALTGNWSCHVGGAFLVPSHAGKFMRAKPQIIKRINHKAPLMRQVPPDVHYCGTWWPHKPPISSAL